jgi:Cu(I)/Ag(I) efflux system protein CusF
MQPNFVFALSLVIGLTGVPLIASASGDHQGSHSNTTKSEPAAASANTAATSSAATSNAAITDGEIRKVNKDAGKITIRHAELKNLDMPAMTMVFQVKDKAMLDQVKTGDKVSFVAEKVDGKFTVTQLEARK